MENEFFHLTPKYLLLHYVKPLIIKAEIYSNVIDDTRSLLCIIVYSSCTEVFKHKFIRLQLFPSPYIPFFIIIFFCFTQKKKELQKEGNLHFVVISFHTFFFFIYSLPQNSHSLFPFYVVGSDRLQTMWRRSSPSFIRNGKNSSKSTGEIDIHEKNKK